MGQRAVRVAILDTGVDVAHSAIQRAFVESRILGCRGFPPSLDSQRDGHGHGTYVATVFFRTAPNAVIFIARVIDDEGNLNSEDDFHAAVQVIRASPFQKY